MSDIENKDYAVKVTNLSKIYKIYKKPWHRILDAVSKKVRYKEFRALDNLSAVFPKGEAIGILGVNGSGKSTLLKMITGVTTASKGTIEVNGRISAMLELTSGFDKELSGIENINLKAISLGIPQDVIESKIDEIAAFADIGDYLYQPVRTYSSGMKSRLGFAISVNMDPDILIVDEVLAVGDDTFKLKCLAKMEEFRKQGKTILFVSHSLFTVKGFCTKAMWIKNGKLEEYGDTGPVVQIYEDYLKELRKKQRIKQLDSEKAEEALTKRDIVKYSKFRMLDLTIDEKPRTNFEYNHPITIRVVYEVKKKVESLTCSFTIRDAEYTELFGADKQNYEVNSEIGIHELEITLTSPKLLPGTYAFSGELWNNDSGLMIGFANKRPFSIKSKEFMGTGMFHMDYEVKQIK